VCVCVCVHVETCFIAFPYLPTGDDENIAVEGVGKSLEEFMYCFSVEGDLAKLPLASDLK